jgi:hypothetical protein
VKLINLYDYNIDNLYKLYVKINKFTKGNLPFLVSFFSLFIHKKLHYYQFVVNDKKVTLSNGQLLKIRTKLTKFFKKSRKSYGASITALNKKLKKKLKKIDFFFCKNFNYKNYL